jgi:hypothetical protein
VLRPGKTRSLKTLLDADLIHEIEAEAAAER